MAWTLFEGASRWAANRFSEGRRAGYVRRIRTASEDEKQSYIDKINELERKEKSRRWSPKRPDTY